MTQPFSFRVLVTRPRPEGEALCQYLQAQGYEALHLPALEIKPLDGNLKEQIAQLDHYAWAIFISRSAVRTSAALIRERWPQLPSQLRMAAVGERTAAALQEAGFSPVLYPAQSWTSEGLLAQPELQQVRGRKLALFCGEGGRDLLENQLRARGAEVTRFVSYRRVLPEQDLRYYQDLLRQKQINAVVVTSMEGLSNLRKMFTNETWLCLLKIPLVLVSERIMIQAKEWGFENCILAKTASHQDISEAFNSIRMNVMNSQENRASTPDSKVPSSKVSGSKTSFWFLLFFLLVLIMSGLMCYRTYMLSQTLSASLGSLAEQAQENKRAIVELQNQAALMQQRSQQQEAVLGQQAQTLQEWRGLSQIGPTSRGRERSAILDAQYFVRLAADQLLLNKDFSQALQLLNRAQMELNPVSDPQALPLKKALNQDLTALQSLPVVNTTHIYLLLTSLQQQLDHLPMLNVPAQPVEAPAAEKAPVTVWEKGLDSIWKVLRQMVVVYHVPNAAPPFMTPDRRLSILYSLQAALNDARWAVLRHDNDIYQNNLQQASAWIRQYFSLSSPLTNTVLNDLQTLQAISLQPSKEVVLLSPQVFEDYLKAEPTGISHAASS